MDARTASITAQVAAKIAADLATEPSQYFVILEQVHADLVKRSTMGVTEAAAPVAAVPAALPDPFAQATANVVAAFPQAAAVPAQPTGADLSTNEGKWADWLANRDNWYDNRDKGDTSQSGGTKPDFRHKEAKDAKGYNIGAWLIDKRYGKHAPDAVFQALGLTPPAPQPTVSAPANFAPTPAPGLPAPF